MYELKEVVLRRGENTKKRLVIEFTERDQAILGEFLMTDAPLLSGKILHHLEGVLCGERDMVSGSGNRCSWKMDAQTAVIDDLFADMAEDIPTLPSCTIETKELYELIDMWFNALKRFANS